MCIGSRAGKWNKGVGGCRNCSVCIRISAKLTSTPRRVGSLSGIRWSVSIVLCGRATKSSMSSATGASGTKATTLIKLLYLGFNSGDDAIEIFLACYP